MWTLSFSTSLRALASAVAGLPSLSSRMTSTFRPAICQPFSCQYSSQPEYMSLPAAAIAPVSGEMKPILIGPWAKASPAVRFHAVTTRNARITVRIAPSRAGSIPVRDRKLVGREERNDLGAARRHDHFFLDASRGHPVGRWTVGLDGEHHPGLQLHRVVERVQPADDRPLVQTEADPVAEVEAEGGHLAVEADLLRFRKRARDLVGGDTGLDERDRLVHPFARLLVSGDLRLRRASHAEGAVVASPVADEGHDDVEERLIARADDPVGEVVRMRAAALARDRIDRLDAVRAHLVEALGGQADDLVFARAGLERLEDVLVDAVDHRGGHVEQGQLVLALEHPRLEHHLLAVAYLDARLLQREEERRLDQVDAERHPGDAFGFQDVAKLDGRLLEEPGLRGDRATHADHARERLARRDLRRVEAMVPRGGAEVPDPGLAVAGQQAPARELVARPLADDGAGEIADVVLVEDEDRAEP